jgi:hypothetical protein
MIGWHARLLGYHSAGRIGECIRRIDLLQSTTRLLLLIAFRIAELLGLGACRYFPTNGECCAIGLVLPPHMNIVHTTTIGLSIPPSAPESCFAKQPL